MLQKKKGGVNMLSIDESEKSKYAIYWGQQKQKTTNIITLVCFKYIAKQAVDILSFKKVKDIWHLLSMEDSKNTLFDMF